MMYFEGAEFDQVIRVQYEQLEQYITLLSELKKQLPEPAETNTQIEMIIRLMTEGNNGIPGAQRTAK